MMMMMMMMMMMIYYWILCFCLDMTIVCVFCVPWVLPGINRLTDTVPPFHHSELWQLVADNPCCVKRRQTIITVTVTAFHSLVCMGRCTCWPARAYSTYRTTGSRCDALRPVLSVLVLEPWMTTPGSLLVVRALNVGIEIWNELDYISLSLYLYNYNRVCGVFVTQESTLMLSLSHRVSSCEVESWNRKSVLECRLCPVCYMVAEGLLQILWLVCCSTIISNNYCILFIIYLRSILLYSPTSSLQHLHPKQQQQPLAALLSTWSIRLASLTGSRPVRCTVPTVDYLAGNRRCRPHQGTIKSAVPNSDERTVYVCCFTNYNVTFMWHLSV